MTSPLAPQNGAPSIAGWAQPPSGLPPLPTMNTMSRRTMLPPADAIRAHDEHCASLLDHIAKVQSAETIAAMQYQTATGWAEARKADEAYVRDWLHRHGELPDVQSGPMAEYPRKLEQLYTQAWRCVWWANIAREDLAAYLRTNTALKDSLSKHADALRDEICAKWIHARDHQDHRAYEDGCDLADQWKATNRLHTWAAKPTMDYQSPMGPRTYPAELQYLEWEADSAVNGGKARPEVPTEALRLPGAPPPKDAPSTMPARGPDLTGEGTWVNGELQTPKRGLFRKG